MKMRALLSALSVLFLSSIAFADGFSSGISGTPTSISANGGTMGFDGSGAASITPAAGQPTNINGSGAYLANPIVFPTISSPTLSGAGQAAMNFDGTRIKLSIGGAAYAIPWVESSGGTAAGLTLTGTTAVTGTFTDSSNYRRGVLKTSTSGVLTISSEGLGTGATGNTIQFATDGTNNWKISGNNLIAATDNSYDIGASGANRPRTGYFGTGITIGASSGVTDNALTFYGVSTVLRNTATGALILQTNALGISLNPNNSITSFGGTSSSFPALKRNATSINVRLADDSADAPITASNVTLSGTLTLSGTAAAPSSTSTPVAWTNAVISGTTYKLPLYQ